MFFIKRVKGGKVYGVTVYFLRHGQTQYNAEKRFYGATDVGLCAEGVAEALNAAGFLKTLVFEAVYASPLSRARETAEIVMERNAAPSDITYIEGLREVNFGDWEGLMAEDIEARYSPDWKEYIEGFQDFTFPNGDSIGAYNERTRNYMEGLLKRHTSGNILIVSHKGFILSAVSNMLHGDSRNMFKYDLDTGKTAVMEFFDGFCILKALNV